MLRPRPAAGVARRDDLHVRMYVLQGLRGERAEGSLPELRRRDLLDTDYVGGDFRANLELPALRREAVAA